MDEFYRSALREVIAEIVRSLKHPHIPTRNPGNDSLFLARIDVQRALEAGCKTPDEIIEFLGIGSEEWFFEGKVRSKVELKLLEATWNRILEREGMPEELPMLAGMRDVEELEVEETIGELRSIDIDLNSILNKLTPRQREILELIAQGLTYRRIAEILGISLGALGSYVRRIRKKLEKEKGGGGA